MRSRSKKVLAHTVERAQRIGPGVGAFVRLTPDRALREADAVQQRLKVGDDAPLLGVPVPIKDLNAVAGVEMNAGSAALAGFVPDHDDGVLTRFHGTGNADGRQDDHPRVRAARLHRTRHRATGAYPPVGKHAN